MAWYVMPSSSNSSSDPKKSFPLADAVAGHLVCHVGGHVRGGDRHVGGARQGQGAQECSAPICTSEPCLRHPMLYWPGGNTGDGQNKLFWFAFNDSRSFVDNTYFHAPFVSVKSLTSPDISWGGILNRVSFMFQIFQIPHLDGLWENNFAKNI